MARPAIGISGVRFDIRHEVKTIVSWLHRVQTDIDESGCFVEPCFQNRHARACNGGMPRAISRVSWGAFRERHGQKCISRRHKATESRTG